MRKAVVGIVAAAAVAMSASDLTVFGIEAWKIVLAAAGAVLFVTASDRRARK